jgi:nucleotide-binding universal stress UspA family protein
MRPAIVCGIDWSHQCWQALRLADELAARSGLPLAALHVTSPAPESVQRERGERLHEGIREVLGRADVPLTIDVGAPSERLAAASRRAALLVIGTHSRGALRQKLLGSVSGALTRRSACPVIVVPSKDRHNAAIGLAATTLLCAARDERDLACAATAACWATDLGLTMTVARALEPPPRSAAAAVAAPPPDVPLTTAERKAAAAEPLRQLLTEISAIAPYESHSCVVLGRPARQLEKLAVSERACLVVLGPRRHGALHEALSRSPIRRLLRRGRLPVMVCPRATVAVLADDVVAPAAPVR